MINKQSISVVIPVYNAEKTLVACLEHCLSQDFLGEYEIIAVDDGSTDNSAQIIKDFGEKVKYVHQQNSGAGSARNKGAQKAQGNILVFTDSDCLPARNWLSTLLQGFSNGQKVAAVQGTYDIANVGKPMAEMINFDIQEKHKNMPKFIKVFGSFNIAIKKEVFIELAGFSSDYQALSAEDVDLSYRLIEKGYQIASELDSKVAHFHTDKLQKYLKEQKRHGYFRVKLYRDHPQNKSGDGYAGWKEMLQTAGSALIFLNVIFLGIELIVSQSLYSLWSLIFFIALVYLVEVPRSLKMIQVKKDWRYLSFAVVMFLRSLWRTVGFLKAFLGFKKI